MNDKVITTVDRQVAGLGRKPVKKLIKVGVLKLSGRMLDPIEHMPTDYLLEGDPNDPDTDLDEITLEFYTEEEWVFFKKKNKALLEAGYLLEYEGDEPEIDTRNVLTDEEIDEVLGKPFLALRNLLIRVDSQVTMRRILDRALALDVSNKFAEAIRARLAELEEAALPPRVPDRVDTAL